MEIQASGDMEETKEDGVEGMEGKEGLKSGRNRAIPLCAARVEHAPK